MRDLRGDGHANREIASGVCKVAAALVAAPIEQDFRHGDAPQELGWVISIGWDQQVVRAHRGGDPNAHGFLPEGRGECSELPRTLQSDRFRVEETRARHRPMKACQQLRILSDRACCFARLTCRRKQLEVVDVKIIPHGAILPRDTMCLSNSGISARASRSQPYAVFFAAGAAAQRTAGLRAARINLALDRQGRRLSAADAESRDAPPQAVSPQRGKQCDDDTRARCADRMAQRTGAP